MCFCRCSQQLRGCVGSHPQAASGFVLCNETQNNVKNILLNNKHLETTNFIETTISGNGRHKRHCVHSESLNFKSPILICHSRAIFGPFKIEEIEDNYYSFNLTSGYKVFQRARPCGRLPQHCTSCCTLSPCCCPSNALLGDGCLCQPSAYLSGKPLLCRWYRHDSCTHECDLRSALQLASGWLTKSKFPSFGGAKP